MKSALGHTSITNSHEKACSEQSFINFDFLRDDNADGCGSDELHGRKADGFHPDSLNWVPNL